MEEYVSTQVNFFGIDVIRVKIDDEVMFNPIINLFINQGPEKEDFCMPLVTHIYSSSTFGAIVGVMKNMRTFTDEYLDEVSLFDAETGEELDVLSINEALETYRSLSDEKIPEGTTIH